MSGTVAATAPVDTGHGMFLVYANMVREFLGKLGCVVDDTEDPVVVFERLAPGLEPVLPEGAHQNAIMSLLVPPPDPVGTVVRDAATLADVKVWGDGTSWGPLLIRAADDDGLAMTWHYVKMMTFTLLRCPPDVLQLMSSMASDLMSKLLPTP
jgi:hypothetical protein